MRIERAELRDLPDVLRLLQQSALPTDGVRDHIQTMVLARDGGRIVGSAGLEVYADGALLRSAAVEASHQGSGLGQRLTQAALDLARERGVRPVFLLTTTAERFFPRFGLAPIRREDVPASVQPSVEFQSACPSSATVMRHDI